MKKKSYILEMFLFFIMISTIDLCFSESLLFAQQNQASKEPKRKTTLDLTYYMDVREYNTLNILTSGKLPFGFHLFGFVDLHGDHNKPAHRFY